MDASRKPSIATEVHASHERPHRLALLATSPVATGEAKLEEPRKGTETQHSANSMKKEPPRFRLAALFVLLPLIPHFSSLH